MWGGTSKEGAFDEGRNGGGLAPALALTLSSAPPAAAASLSTASSPNVTSCGQACNNGAVGYQVNLFYSPGYYTLKYVFSDPIPNLGTYRFDWQNSVTEGTSSSRFQYTYLTQGSYSGSDTAEWGPLWSFNSNDSQYYRNTSYVCSPISTYENPVTDWTINQNVNSSNPASIDQYVWISVNCTGGLNGVTGASTQNLYNVFP